MSLYILISQKWDKTKEGEARQKGERGRRGRREKRGKTEGERGRADFSGLRISTYSPQGLLAAVGDTRRHMALLDPWQTILLAETAVLSVPIHYYYRQSISK